MANGQEGAGQEGAGQEGAEQEGAGRSALACGEALASPSLLRQDAWTWANGLAYSRLYYSRADSGFGGMDAAQTPTAYLGQGR
ncbi:unnamed protein product [Lota lota]